MCILWSCSVSRTWPTKRLRDYFRGNDWIKHTTLSIMWHQLLSVGEKNKTVIEVTFPRPQRNLKNKQGGEWEHLQLILLVIMRARWVNQQKANMPVGVSRGGTPCLLSLKSKYSGVVDLFKWDGCSFHATQRSSDISQDDFRRSHGAFCSHAHISGYNLE